MSPASRSKSRDKKAGKEPHKGSSNPSGNISTNGGTPASGYNPLLGTFHTFEPPQVPSVSPLQTNGRFRNIDDTDDQNGNTIGSGLEYDSVSNNGSWSGESEDHKERASQPPSQAELVPGADNDKREKIRQKNEKKHQRQKERRAQELHERCRGYLMSSKLEALAQQLVSMGFSQERATMALILNEGRVEESVSWLFEGGEDNKHINHNIDGGGNLKIDISEEIARITDMEVRYKASKQEVERAIVACEGDIDKAEEMLKAQKQEPPAVPPKLEETSDHPATNGKLPAFMGQNAITVQAKPTSSIVIQQKMDEKDFNYTKARVTAGPSVDPGPESMQDLKKIQPKSEWAKTQQIPVPADKRLPGSGSNPSVSCSFASPFQASPPPGPKMEARYLAVGNELKNLQLGSVREPVTVMQRPKSANAKQPPSSSVSSSPPGAAMGWYSSSMDTGKPNGQVPPVAVNRSLGPGGIGSNLVYNPVHYQSQPQLVPNSRSIGSQGNTRGSGLWSKGGASSTLSAASSLGLFSGLGMSGSSSPVDWSTGSSMSQLDYTNVDWSLDRTSVASRPNALLAGPNYSLQNNVRRYNSFGYGMGTRSAMKPVNGGPIQGLNEGVASTEPAGGGGGGAWEWTSPFEERDLFSLPRQFVSSPSL